MFRVIVLALFLSAVAAFSPSGSKRASTAVSAKSAAVPFLEKPDALDGSMAGDVGFDPMGFSNAWLEKDWSQQIVPDIMGTMPNAEARTSPVSTIQWMREAELKHSRVAMIAVVGWLVVECGVRFPGSSFTSIPSSMAAHDAAVSNGSMGFLLTACFIAELAGGAAIFDMAKGSGRKPGDFSFDPFKLSKSPERAARYAQAEIKNGRLAMMAISGILTQSAAFPDKGLFF